MRQYIVITGIHFGELAVSNNSSRKKIVYIETLLNSSLGELVIMKLFNTFENKLTSYVKESKQKYNGRFA